MPRRLAGWVRATARVTAERLDLLRSLGVAGPGRLAVLCGAHAAVAAVPTLLALAGGHAVGTLADPGAGVTVLVAALLVGALLFAGELLHMLQGLARSQVAHLIDGSVRSRVRRFALAPGEITHLETRDFQDDAARAADRGTGIGRTRSAGTAAVGQLTLVFRMLSAAAATVLFATFFQGTAVLLLAVSLAVRTILRRQWTALADVLDAGAQDQRRVLYFADLCIRGAAMEVRLFGLADWLSGRFRAASFVATAPAWRRMWHVLRRQWWTLGLVAGSAGVALAVPGAAALSGAIGPDELMTCVLAAWGIFGIASMGQEAFDIEYGLNAVRAVERLTDRYGAVRATPLRGPEQPSPRHPPLVRFEGVGFTYPGADRPVFDCLDLTLRPGESLAIVGENGAGKTTLVKLLAGLYRPTRGQITVDGQPLSDLDSHAWRRRMTVLFQDFVRYPADLRDNVALSAPERLGDDALVAEVLRGAGAQDLVADLPDGVRTLLWREGERGTDLSGGQWQRVAIARALYAVAAGRRILVLDEPTAHLDMRAEAAFYERIVRAVQDVTAVLVSHRLSTVRPADRIVLLADGRVAEEGTHDDLMALDGVYRRFFTLQAGAFAEEPS